MSALYDRMKNCLSWHCWDVAGPETKIINGAIQKNCFLMAGKIISYVLLPELPELPEITVTDAVPEERQSIPGKDPKGSGYPPKQV